MYQATGIEVTLGVMENLLSMLLKVLQPWPTPPLWTPTSAGPVGVLKNWQVLRVVLCRLCCRPVPSGAGLRPRLLVVLMLLHLVLAHFQALTMVLLADLATTALTAPGMALQGPSAAGPLGTGPQGPG